MRFESTIAACWKYRAMPLQIEGDIATIRHGLINATGAMRFSVRGFDRIVSIAATGEVIGRMYGESE